MSKEKPWVPNTKVLSNEGKFANFPFDIGFTVPFCMNCPCEAGSVGMLQKLQAALHNSLLLKLQNFSLVFLEVKLDNFLTREGIIQELLL
jgi:hypothetical protein